MKFSKEDNRPKVLVVRKVLPTEPKWSKEFWRASKDHAEKWQTIQEERKKIISRMAKLTPREQEVMRLLASGKKNKTIAEELGISRKTLDIHRAKVMGKMEARTVADSNWIILLDQENLPK